MLVSADWIRGNPPRRRRRGAQSQFPAGCPPCVAIMVDVMESPKARINASMLAQFIDQPVCFVGRLEKVRALTALGFLAGGAPRPWGWRPQGR